MNIDETRNESRLLGCVDNFFSGFLVGWALDSDNDGAPVDIELLVDGKPVGRATASHNRDDLLRQFGSGAHGFAVYIGELLRQNQTNFNVRINSGISI